VVNESRRAVISTGIDAYRTNDSKQLSPLIAVVLFLNELGKKLDRVTLKATERSLSDLFTTVICIANVNRQEAVASDIGT
jgi:hypothetical protein